jgi:hypothetical protein
MSAILDSPVVLLAASLGAQLLAVYAGGFVRRRLRPLSKDEHQDFDTVQTASLTLLALIIGFSFSMAVTRYEQRKTYEESEANAIGTEFARADLLPIEDAANLRNLLARYLAQRILFYETRDRGKVPQVEADTAKVQNELWSIVSRVAGSQPSPVLALVVSGMNDVFNSQGYTQAAWWNRIPLPAWAMMGLIALACNALLGYGERRGGALLLVALPTIISISFLLIADMDSPRGGIIRVHPQNLMSVSVSIKAGE